MIVRSINLSFDILSVAIDAGFARLGFHFRLPFDYASGEGPDYVLGLSLTVPL